MPISADFVPRILQEMALVSRGIRMPMTMIVHRMSREVVLRYDLTPRKLVTMVKRMGNSRQGDYVVTSYPDEIGGPVYSVRRIRKSRPKPEPAAPKLYPTRFEREEVI